MSPKNRTSNGRFTQIREVLLHCGMKVISSLESLVRKQPME